MNYGSVCSGIEAASQAWHTLGWKPSFLSEIDEFPRAVLHHHYPDVPIHGDFTTIEEDQYESIDLLVGGTPCQSFSIAGLRGGLSDDRGNLALEYLRLADRLSARWLVWENVPGVLSSSGGRDFGSFLGALAQLGYGFAYRVLDAQFFGVAQRRRRVFLVGYRGDYRRAASVLFESESLRRDTAPSRSEGQRVAPTVVSGPPFSRTGNERVECEAILVARMRGFGDYECDGTASTVKARDYKDATDLVAEKDLGVRRLTPVECERLQGFPDNFTQVDWRGKDAIDCPDSHRYKALGNSMAVPVMQWIGSRIDTVDKAYA